MLTGESVGTIRDICRRIHDSHQSLSCAGSRPPVTKAVLKSASTGGEPAAGTVTMLIKTFLLPDAHDHSQHVGPHRQ